MADGRGVVALIVVAAVAFAGGNALADDAPQAAAGVVPFPDGFTYEIRVGNDVVYSPTTPTTLPPPESTTTEAATTTVEPTTTEEATTSTVAASTTTTSTTISTPATTTTAPTATTTTSTTTTSTTTVPSSSTIPASQLPRGNPGSPNALIQNSPQQGPSGDVSGNFRFICGWSHMSYDDPIVWPNQPGRSHLHVFGGNTGTNAASTHTSLRAAGNGTCSGGTLNRSAYWMPVVMNGGTPVQPDHFQIYYKSGYRAIAPAQVKNIPDGLVLLAGNPNALTDQSSEIVEWYCSGASTVATHITNCGNGHEVQASITYPQCWDGVHLDSADHRSHMAYPGSGSHYGEGCPADHPVAIPVITLTMFFNQPTASIANLRLASDQPGAVAGASLHADYIEAWDPVIRDGFTQHCIREHRDCTRGLGDARQLVDPPGI